MFVIVGRVWRSEPGKLEMASENYRIRGREFMEETYRDTSVSNSLDDPSGRVGIQLGLATSIHTS